MGKRRGGHGHYCWCCGLMRPNERFTGRGHRRHLCKECASLGKNEIEFRQHVRDIERLLTWDGMVPRRHRETFRRYLCHAEERVRAHAARVAEHDARARAARRREALEIEARELARAEASLRWTGHLLLLHEEDDDGDRGEAAGGDAGLAAPAIAPLDALPAGEPPGADDDLVFAWAQLAVPWAARDP